MLIFLLLFALVSFCAAWVSTSPALQSNNKHYTTDPRVVVTTKNRKHTTYSLKNKESDDIDTKDEVDTLGQPKWMWMRPPDVSLPTLFAGSLIGVGITLVTLLYGPVDEVLSGQFDPSSRTEMSSRAIIGEDVALFQDILQDLENDYVDKIDPRKLFQTGMKAMLNSLDPYTEFEDLKAAKAMQEQVSGKYGGVGLVISTNKKGATTSAVPPANTNRKDRKGPTGSAPGTGAGAGESNGNVKGKKGTGVVVVDAFEGYAYNAGVRVGDRIRAINGEDVSKLEIDQVRDRLRGDPDTDLTIIIDRDGTSETLGPVSAPKSQIGTKQPQGIVLGADPESVQKDVDLNRGNSMEINLQRRLVRISDVKLATLLGDASEGVGYINLSGFTSGAGRDFRDALLLLRATAAAAPPISISTSSPTNAPIASTSSRSGANTAGSVNGNDIGDRDLKALILDLRGNPGGLLDAAVEVASYLVPANSDIVSAKSKNGQEVVYRSSIKPIIPSGMKLVVLVNKGSASASEIVAGAIQDLDAGVVVGPSSTYGKGLVQKIVPLAYDSALKYTVAKYYTPSGRCIQAIQYKGGRTDVPISPRGPDVPSGDGVTPFPSSEDDSVSQDGDPLPEGSKEDGGVQVADKDRKFYKTRQGRSVRDGGGIEPDLVVNKIQVGAAESILYSQGVYNDFAEQFVKKYPLARDQISRAAMSEQKQRRAVLTNILRQALGDNADDDSDVGTGGSTTITLAVAAEEEKRILRDREKVALGPLPISASTAQFFVGFGADTNSGYKGASGRLVGTTSRIPDKFFWGQQTGPMGGLSSQGVGELVYKEFKQYVLDHVTLDSQTGSRQGKIDLEASTPLKKQIDELRAAIITAGLASDNKVPLDPSSSSASSSTSSTSSARQVSKGSKLIAGLDQLHGLISKSIIEDMDRNKKFIQDGVELAVLSRELPDRLIIYHTVIQDEQVTAAYDLASGKPSVPAYENILSKDRQLPVDSSGAASAGWGGVLSADPSS